ncbi:MAG: type II toxin-antitoxin system YafQ family toxin [Bacteroidaceae bacterium]|nr:type II toxin-antitoxin system YafQ family toxin [Bacteroidaceae bacterium]
MAYIVKISNRFKKQFRLCMKRGLDMNLINEAMRLLAANGSLPAQYRPHKLSGKFQGIWECHIEPDWLLIWEQNDTELILLFTGTGTHSDLF